MGLKVVLELNGEPVQLESDKEIINVRYIKKESSRFVKIDVSCSPKILITGPHRIARIKQLTSIIEQLKELADNSNLDSRTFNMVMDNENYSLHSKENLPNVN